MYCTEGIFFRDKHLSGCPDLILIYTPCTVRAKKIGVKDPSDFYKDPTKYNGLKVIRYICIVQLHAFIFEKIT